MGLYDKLLPSDTLFIIVLPLQLFYSRAKSLADARFFFFLGSALYPLAEPGFYCGGGGGGGGGVKQGDIIMGERCISSPIGVWGGAPPALQLSRFLKNIA